MSTKHEAAANEEMSKRAENVSVDGQPGETSHHRVPKPPERPLQVPVDTAL